MATASDTDMDLAVAEWRRGRDADGESKSDRYLARRLAAASADYKGVALTTFLLGAAVGGGVWLLGGVLVEHWLMPGGLPPAARWGWLAIAVGALAIAAWRSLLPLVLYRVNLVYAARAIEREHPELHNDLVNTVLVKAHPDANPDKVVRSLERRTAKRLADVPAEAVIDRTPALRLALALAAVVGLAGLYEVAAPKSLLVSAARLVAPWAGWAAPSRVRINAPRLAWRMPAEQDTPADLLDRRRLIVDGGRATLVRGRQLVVTADIRGLRRGETPAVAVAPLLADLSIDPKAAAWRTDMTRSQAAGGQRMFAALLPDATRGLDQSVEIRIAAGDALSEPLRVAVVDAPTLLVREVRYAFPPYTRRPPETVAWQGDIRAVEGTEVTIVAESNQPLDDAWIDFEADGSRDLRFTKSAADFARVTKLFSLHLKADGSGPEYGSYRLLFQPRAAEGAAREQVIVDPLEHRIEVLADVSPEVAIEEPRTSPLRVPPAAPVTVRVTAHDPDFALARVAIETRLQGGPAGSEVVMLEAEQTGGFRGATQIVPERCGAGPGATLEYRAVASDNRPKRPNVSHSPWQTLQIDPTAPPPQPSVPPPGQRQADRQRGNGDGQGERGLGQESGQGQQGDSPQGAGKQADPGDGKQQDGKQQDGKQQDGKQQDGKAAGAQSGDRQQEPQDGKQAGNQQGQGQNQGQGAEQGQGVGAQGERQGGREQSGRQQSGTERDGGGGQRGSGQKTGGQAGSGASGQRGQTKDTTVAADGTNDGEAIERILEHRREQGGKDAQGAPRDGEQQGQQQGEQQGGESEKKPASSGQSQSGDGQSGERGNDAAQPGGERGGKEKSGQGGDQKGGDQKGGDQKGGDQKGGSGQSAGNQSDGGQEASGQPSGQAGTSAEGAPGKGGSASGDKPGPGTSADGSKPGAGERGAGERGAGERGSQGAGTQAEAGTGNAGEGKEKGGQQTSGEPGAGAGETGSGGWAGGDGAERREPRPPLEGPAPSKETEWGEQELAHARNAADLAVEHLRRDVESGANDVLDRLGWTRDEGRAFLERWEKMRKLAASAEPGERGEFARMLQSLGLRPDGVRSSRDVPADVRGGQAEGRRSRPPSDYLEQFKAYTQGTAGE